MADTETRTPVEKFVTLYDTAKKCLLLIDQLYSDFGQYIESAGDGSPLAENEAITLHLYISALGIIDFIHRFSQIIDAMPLLSKRRPEVKKLNENVKMVKECRHYIQHIRKHLSADEHISFPILGSISWIADNKNYVLFSNQITKSHQTHGISFDNYDKRYMCKYQLVIGPFRVEIDKVYESVKQFWEWLESISHISPIEIKNYEWGKPMVIYSAFDEP